MRPSGRRCSARWPNGALGSRRRAPCTADWMRDRAQRDEHAHVRQRAPAALRGTGGRCGSPRASACSGAAGIDRVDDDRAVQRKPVVRPRLVVARRPARISAASRTAARPAIIAGERPAGAVRALLARREADDRQPGLGVAEARAPARSTNRDGGAHSSRKRDEARAQRAIARRFGLGQRRDRPIGPSPFGPSLSSPPDRRTALKAHGERGSCIAFGSNRRSPHGGTADRAIAAGALGLLGARFASRRSPRRRSGPRRPPIRQCGRDRRDRPTAAGLLRS